MMNEDNFSQDDMALVDEYASMFADGDTSMDVEQEELEHEEPTEVVEEEETQGSEEEGETEGEEIETVDPEGLFTVKVNDEDVNVSVKELSEAYMDNTMRKAEWEKIDTFKQEALTQSKSLIEALQLSKLESELILEDSKSTQWDNLSAEDYRTQMMARQKLESKIGLINGKLEELQNQVKQAEEAKERELIMNARTRLEREVAGFNNDVYTGALEHAVNVLGVDKDVAESLKDAGLIKLLIEAHRAHVNPSKVSKASMPKKVIKPKQEKVSRNGYVDGNLDLPEWASDLF